MGDMQWLHDRVLAEHNEWMRNLEAERVTHSNETFQQLMRRLRMERAESPAERLRRLA